MQGKGLTTEPFPCKRIVFIDFYNQLITKWLEEARKSGERAYTRSPDFRHPLNFHEVLIMACISGDAKTPHAIMTAHFRNALFIA